MQARGMCHWGKGRGDWTDGMLMSRCCEGHAQERRMYEGPLWHVNQSSIHQFEPSRSAWHVFCLALGQAALAIAWSEFSRHKHVCRCC